MNNPSEFSNLGEGSVLDQRALDAELSNEQLEDIKQRMDLVESEEMDPTQAATVAEPAPIEPEPQPTGEQPQSKPGLFQGLSYFGQPLGETGQQVQERLSAPGQGIIDTAVDGINKLIEKTGFQVPKATKYEDGVAQWAREVSSVALPTLILQGKGMELARGAQAKTVAKLGPDALINRLGNTAWMKFIGSRGVEAGASVGVGAVTTQYETDDNLAGVTKKLMQKHLPPQWDFIPDNWATLDGEGTDIKKHKNMNEDLAMGFILPMVGFARKFSSATDELITTFTGTVKNPAIVGESDQAIKYLAANKPKPVSEVPEEALLQYQAKQDEALDELGYYNQGKGLDPNEPIKGVHDLFDFRETGMRTVDDFGIVGASVDAARIQSNKGTVNGRLGNFISGPAIKYGNETPGGVEEITIGLTQQLKEADRVGMVAPDYIITSDEVAAAGDNLVLELFDPSATIEDMRRVLDPQINEFGGEVLSPSGYTDALSSISTMVKNYRGIDVAKAQAYTATSISGQIADLSEGIRINKGSVAIENAQQNLLDKINFLQQLVGSTKYFTTQKKGLLALTERIGNKFKTPEQIANSIRDNYPTALREIQTESEKFTDNWMYLQENNPEILDTFLELYEHSDGKINTIARMNEDIVKSFAKFNYLYDPDPSTPNIIGEAVRANWFNSKLSAFLTSSGALVGNLGGIIAEPITYFAGAMLRKDLKSAQRGWMAYNAFFDTQRKSLPYAGQMFMKASQNPNSVKGQTRLDLVLKHEAKLEQYKFLAKREAEEGRYGFQFLVDKYEEMQDMAMDPIFRLQTNLMTGFDSWTGATLANAQARFRAMDELERLGEAATSAKIKELADAEYNSMFDADGLIKDKAVKYRTADIALNLDTSMAKDFDNLIVGFPWMRQFVTYPKMFANLFRLADDYLPAPFKSFQQDINELAYTPVKTFVENPDLMDSILAKRGYKIDEMDETARLNALIDIKNRTLGRKATSSFITGLLVANVIKDKVFGDGLFDTTGDGSFNRALNNARIKNSNFKVRSFVTPDGTRVEYEKLLGPGLSNWVAAVANTVDNFDMLGEAGVENSLRKLTFILAASFADQGVVSALRPLTEMLSGNEKAMMRWAAGNVNALGPLAGLRNEAGQLLDAGIKAYNNDLLEILNDRNRIAGLFDPVNRLPTIVSPVTGEAPNSYSMLQRLFNNYSPIKIHPKMTEEEQFLYDIEYDVTSSFSTKNGVQLTAQEQAALFEKMGEQKYFKREIKRISRVAEARNTIEELKKMRRFPNFITSQKSDIGLYDGIHTQLDAARKEAEKRAYDALDFEIKNGIDQRIRLKEINDQRARQGLQPIQALEIKEQLTSRY